MSLRPHPGLALLLRAALLAAALGPLLLAVPPLLTTEVERAVLAAPPPPVEAPTASSCGETATGLRPVLGFAINAHHIGDLAAYLRAVDEIAAMGANTLLLVTPMYQRRIDSEKIRLVPSKCPTRAQVRAILDRARHHHLRTVLLPIVLIEKPRDREWRGLLRPDDWDAWWRSYGDFIDYYATIAAEAEVDVLCIGSELNSTESQLERWRAVADRARRHFDGLLAYSANWDRYHVVELWPLVDVMGVSAYFELQRSRPGAPEAELVAAWTPLREALLETATRWNRPLLLTEVGYPSLPWANAHPWDYVDKGERADHELQARCWRAFFAAWGPVLGDPQSGLLGFCGYRWDPYHRGDERDTGYGIVGKPAFDVLARGFGELGGDGGKSSTPEDR